MTFQIESINISKKKGTAKIPVPEAELLAGHGIAGDAHAGPWHRQISFLAAEAIERMRDKGLKVGPGSFGENIVTRGIDWTKIPIGTHISIGATELEITQIGKECRTPCAIFYQAGDCIMPREGVFARVLKGGIIHAQDRGDYRI